MNILKEIVSQKKEKIIKRERNKKIISFSEELIKNNKLGHLALISEIKPRSPSQGDLRQIQDPVELAKIMQNNGAAAISVLTEENYFGGRIENLIDISQKISLPLLRKDFITSAEEIDNTYNCNADAILLIVALLKEDTDRLFEKCIEVGLEALVEVHNVTELDIAIDIGAKMIGINNRDLTSLKIDLKTTERLIQSIPKNMIVISESGVIKKRDAEYLASLGANAILVGSSLMQSSNVGNAIKQLSEIKISNKLEAIDRILGHLFLKNPINGENHAWVKICGITSLEDLNIVAESGANAVGMVVEVPRSPRNIPLSLAKELIKATPFSMAPVIVTVPDNIRYLEHLYSEVKDLLRMHGGAIQVHGLENSFKSIRDKLAGVRLIRAIQAKPSLNIREIVKISNYCDAILLDSFVPEKQGGSGVTHDWQISGKIKKAIAPTPLILAGGLSSQNIVAAITTVKPWGVDVSTGVEASPGLKDHTKVFEFVRNTKEVDI